VEDYRGRLVAVSQERVKALLEGYLSAHGQGLSEYSRRPGVYYFDLPDTDGAKTRYSDVVFDRERAVADDGLTYLHLNHPVIQRILGELGGDRRPAMAQLRLRPEVLPAGVSLPDGPGLWAVYRLRMTNHDDVDRQELVSVFVDESGQAHPRLAQALLDLTPDWVDTRNPVFGKNRVSGPGLAVLQDQARQLAEAQAADRFSEAQLAHAERLADERKKIERYYCQQEMAVAQIAIENIRQAKQRELLERRRADLAALDHRLTLVPDLALVGMAAVE